MKRKVGRPTKYTEQIQQQAEDYLLNYEEHGDVVPSLVGLSLFLGIGIRTVQDWNGHKNKTKFSRTLEKIHAKQHQTALNKGLTGEFKAPIAKLLLFNHGYSDKVKEEKSGQLNINITRS